MRSLIVIGIILGLTACGTVPPYYGQPTIRDADGRIIGYTTEGLGGSTEVRDRDGRLKYTVEPGYRSPHRPPGER